MKIKHALLTFMIAAALIVTGFAPVLPAADVSAPAGVSKVYASSSKHYVSCKKMYKQINKFRTRKKVWEWKQGSKKKKYYNTKKSNKLKPLKRDKDLEKTAKKRAKEIKKQFSHTRPNGKDWYSIYPKKFNIVGENIAMGYPTISSVMKGWEETDKPYEGQGHRRNLLDKRFTKVGVACFEVNGYRYWVQCFGG